MLAERDLTTVNPNGDVELAALFAALRRLRCRGASIAIVGGEHCAGDVFDAAALDGLIFTMTVRHALLALDQVASLGGPPSPYSLSPAAGRQTSNPD